MRKSTSGGRTSFAAPLRVRNEDASKPSSSLAISNRYSAGSRLSTGSTRSSVGGRLSFGSRKSVSRYNAYPSSTMQQKKRHSSGIGIRGRNDVPKDPRPVSDRSYQHKLIRILCEFLTENGYPHSISVKILQSPSSKDFFKIFEFLYGHMEPNFKLSPKPDEEVPKIFKLLGYPFAISKSSMHAIGTPHTWPHILAAVVWFVDLVKAAQWMKDTAGIDSILFPPKEDDFDHIPDDKVLFDYVELTYAAFLSGEDDYEAFDEELSRVLSEKYLGMAGGIEGLTAENTRLTQELELLEQDSDRLRTLGEQKEISLSDFTRFSAYLSELEAHKLALENQLKEMEEDTVALSTELETIEQKNRHMLSIYETQKLTPTDVERIKLNRQELQRHTESLEKTIEAIDKDIWREEMNMAKSREKLDSKINEYNKMAQALKLIPVTAENAHGIDYELRSGFHSTMLADFEGVIKPALMQLKKQCSDSLHEKESQKLKQLDQLEQMVENVTDAREELDMMQKNIKKTEEELECKKEVFQREHQRMQDEIDSIQKEILELQKSSQLNLQDAQKELREVQKWAEQREADRTKAERKAVDFLQSVVNEVVIHKTAIQARLQEVVAKDKDLLKQVRAEYEQSLQTNK